AAKLINGLLPRARFAFLAEHTGDATHLLLDVVPDRLRLGPQLAQLAGDGLRLLCIELDHRLPAMPDDLAQDAERHLRALLLLLQNDLLQPTRGEFVLRPVL